MMDANQNETIMEPVESNLVPAGEKGTESDPQGAEQDRQMKRRESHKGDRKKGNQFQDWIAKYLEDTGWSVHNQKPTSKMLTDFRTGQPRMIKGRPAYVSTRNDIWGCIDLLAVKQGEKVLAIAATMSSDYRKDIPGIKNTNFEFEHTDVQVWHKIAPGHVNIYRVRDFNKEPDLCKKASMVKIGEIRNRKWIPEAPATIEMEL
jgi:hypothetical protein